MAKVFEISRKALEVYEKTLNREIKNNHCLELIKRRLSAYIASCEMTGLYRDIGDNKTVFSIGKMKICTKGNFIYQIYFTKESSRMNTDFSFYLKRFSKVLGISLSGKTLLEKEGD
jgi:hypothetical protein